MRAKIISSEKTGKAERWIAPSVGEQQPEHKPAPIPEQHANELHEKETQTGFEQGYEAGLQTAVDDLSANRKQLAMLFQSMAQPLEQLNETVEKELYELALEIARQILRREITEDPKHIIGLIRQAILQLPSASRNIRIHLHPEDAAIVRETLSQNEDAQRWRLEDDATLQRGACHVHTDTSFMDAGIDALINRLSLEMLGGKRETDIKEAEDADIESG